MLTSWLSVVSGSVTLRKEVVQSQMKPATLLTFQNSECGPFSLRKLVGNRLTILSLQILDKISNADVVTTYLKGVPNESAQKY